MTAQTPSRGSRTLKDTSGRSPLCVSHTSARCCGVHTCPAASARSTAYAPGWHAHCACWIHLYAFGWESFLGCACCMLHRACCMLHVACCIVHGSWSGVGRSAAPAQGSDLQAKMRHVVGERGEARAKGQRGRLDVLAKYQHTKVVPACTCQQPCPSASRPHWSSPARALFSEAQEANPH